MKFLLLLIISILFVNCGDLSSRRDGSGGGKPPIVGGDDKTWFHLSPDSKDKMFGASIDLAYEKLEIKTPEQPVIVAVLSDGFDLDHPSLKDRWWVNEAEVNIKDGEVDPDKNGYKGDKYGWNFLGNVKAGENIDVAADNLSIARYYKKNKCVDGEKRELCIDLSSEITEKKAELVARHEHIENVEKVYGNNTDLLKKYTETSEEVLKKFKHKDEQLMEARDTLIKLYEDNRDIDFKDIANEEALSKLAVNHHYNSDSKLREDVVGEAPAGYGNSDVSGGAYGGKVGTHIASVIAGIRTKDGAKGISEHVKIMPLRVATHGDPRDKDIESALEYAVKMKADIIVIGFEKRYSINVELVDTVMKESRDKSHKVMIVIPAGDRFEKLVAKDEVAINSFPRCYKAVNCIKVGASARRALKDIQELPFSSSNYSKEFVHIFAPGDNIYGAIPRERYAPLSGTVSAAAVTAGILALGRSQNRGLTAVDMFSKLYISSRKELDGQHVFIPQQTRLDLFSELSETGRIVDAFSFIKSLSE